MKKIITLAFISMSFIATKAQRNTLLVGGDAGFGTSKGESFGNTNKGMGYTLAPYIGYQFSDNWTVGTRLNFIRTKNEQSNSTEMTSSSFAIGPFVRYTKKLSDIFYVYGQLDAVFGRTKNSNGTIGDLKSNYTNVQLFPAVFINLKNNFGLNLAFGGITFARGKDDLSYYNQFSVNFGSSANIGISKNFSFRKK